jgi:hypothetical protein
MKFHMEIQSEHFGQGRDLSIEGNVVKFFSVGAKQTKTHFYSFLNRIPVMAPILAPILGVHFFGGIFPSKMGRFAPFLATIQALSKTCAFLLNKRSEACFVSEAPQLVLAPTIFIIALNMCFVSWESTPARVKASKRGAKSYPRGK